MNMFSLPLANHICHDLSTINDDMLKKKQPKVISDGLIWFEQFKLSASWFSKLTSTQTPNKTSKTE